MELIAEEEKPWICQVLTISPMTAAKEARNATKLRIFPMIHLVDTTVSLLTKSERTQAAGLQQ